MAMIFQDPMTSLNPVMKIGKQITESIRQHLDVSARTSPTSSPRTCSRRCASPSRRQRLKEYPHQLSGGMRQRVCIAVALACGPKLLFADEPTTALDVTVQAQVLDLMASSSDERFMAMVLITHDLGVVAGRADEIAVMYAGRIVEKAPTCVLFADMKMPYTEALLSSIPKLGEPQPHPAGDDPRPAARPRQPAARAASSRRGARTCRTAAARRSRRCTRAAHPGHEYRCWFPVGTPEGTEALERNRATAASGTTAGAPAAAVDRGRT